MRKSDITNLDRLLTGYRWQEFISSENVLENGEEAMEEAMRQVYERICKQFLAPTREQAEQQRAEAKARLKRKGTSYEQQQQPVSRRGGYRPGAGRKRKQRDQAERAS